jgi:hypothetical protein
VTDDDLLSLPADGEPPREPAPGASAPSGATQPPAPAGSAHRPELLALSSEARLATALLMQAQALDGLHRTHADLLRRLEDAPDPAELQRTLEELRRDVLGQLARERRRARRARGWAAALAALVLAIAGLGLFVERERIGASFAELRRGVDGARSDQRSDIERAVADAVTRASGEQAAALAEIQRRIDRREVDDAPMREKLEQLEQVTAERDGLQQQLVAATGEVTTLKAAQDKHEQALAAVREERNKQIGENSRLREKLVDQDRRLLELGRTLEALHVTQAARAEDAPPIVSSSGGGNPLAVRVTAAMRASGVSDAQLLEIGGVSDGALQEVLVAWPAAGGRAPAVLQAASARLVAEHGRAWLRLEQARMPGADAAAGAPRDVELPALDTDAWRALGVALPPGFVPLPQVKAALEALIAPHGYRVAELGSFDGERLGELVLRQEDANGVPLRTLHAREAVLLPVGPELELRDGATVTDGDERPFFHGVFRLALPGSDFGAWLAAVGGAP